MYIIYYPAGIYLKLLVHREIDFKLDNTWEDDALFWKVRSDDCKFEDNNCIILKLTYLTIQPVFIWSYLCIGRLISNLITRERKMLFFERCALPWMKVTLAYQDKLTNTLNLKKREKKKIYFPRQMWRLLFCSYLCVYSLYKWLSCFWEIWKKRVKRDVIFH